jgi:hypothetical protein
MVRLRHIDPNKERITSKFQLLSRQKSQDSKENPELGLKDNLNMPMDMQAKKRKWLVSHCKSIFLILTQDCKSIT